MIRILVILLRFHKNFDFKDFDQNSSVFQSENLMTMEFLWNSRKLQEKFNQYSDQKIRWPRNSYEILENYKKSLDIPKIPTSAYSSKTFSSLFNHKNNLDTNLRFVEEKWWFVLKFDIFSDWLNFVVCW